MQVHPRIVQTNLTKLEQVLKAGAVEDQELHQILVEKKERALTAEERKLAEGVVLKYGNEWRHHCVKCVGRTVQAVEIHF